MIIPWFSQFFSMDHPEFPRSFPHPPGRAPHPPRHSPSWPSPPRAPRTAAPKPPRRPERRCGDLSPGKKGGFYHGKWWFNYGLTGLTFKKCQWSMTKITQNYSKLTSVRCAQETGKKKRWCSPMFHGSTVQPPFFMGKSTINCHFQ